MYPVLVQREGFELRSNHPEEHGLVQPGKILAFVLAEARRDIMGPRPRLSLRNRAWPIRRDLLMPVPGEGRRL